MSVMENNERIKDVLKDFMAESRVLSTNALNFMSKRPFDRVLRVYEVELSIAEEMRIKILQNISVFSALAINQLKVMSHSMESRIFSRGQAVIKQDELGDAFYILEHGEVLVTRKKNVDDPDEVAKELARLGRGGHFGEMSLITDELRSATVTVTSPTAQCLVMTKEAFEKCMVDNRKIAAESMRAIGQEVVEHMPLFHGMSKFNKRHIVNALVPMTFTANTYICRQGIEGQTFYIITAGKCRVTVNVDGGEEKEVASLATGDFFGEMALLSEDSLRTANVVALEKVTCMTLAAPDFQRLFRSQKGQFGALAAHSAKQKRKDTDANEEVEDGQHHRRVTGLDKNNKPNAQLTAGLFLSFSRYVYESMWLSMYWRLYRRIMFNPSEKMKVGNHGVAILSTASTRNQAVAAIREKMKECLETPMADRTSSDVSFICGLLMNDNEFVQRYGGNWTEKQFRELAKRVHIRTFSNFEQIFRTGELCSAAYVILRGAVRVFKGVKSSHTVNLRSVYLEEKVPGEIIGEAVLEGMDRRMFTMQAVTKVEVLAIEEDDFRAVTGDLSKKLSVQQRYSFLLKNSIFSTWDSYKLYSVAQVMKQVEIGSNKRLFQLGIPADRLVFVLKGSIGVVSSLNEGSVVAQVLPGDCVGETSVLDFFFGSSKKKRFGEEWIEENSFVTGMGVEILYMEPKDFGLLDFSTVGRFKEQYLSRRFWRDERSAVAVTERRAFTKLVRFTKTIGAQVAEGVKLDAYLEDELLTRTATPGNAPLIDDDSRSISSVISVATSLPPVAANVPESATRNALSSQNSTASLMTTATLGSLASTRRAASESREKLATERILDMTTDLDASMDPIFAVNTCKTEKQRKNAARVFERATELRILKNARNSLRSAALRDGIFPPVVHGANNTADDVSTIAGSIGGPSSLASFSTGFGSIMLDTRKV